MCKFGYVLIAFIFFGHSILAAEPESIHAANLPCWVFKGLSKYHAGVYADYVHTISKTGNEISHFTVYQLYSPLLMNGSMIAPPESWIATQDYYQGGRYAVIRFIALPCKKIKDRKWTPAIGTFDHKTHQACFEEAAIPRYFFKIEKSPIHNGFSK